ncbi:arginyl-tRNA synthetase [Apostasia shenzhenica]|uniref:Arginyl-tRNA synthetase n=1 Tax=Apostasia shenzhenica TaxID=1088818 RepID=A0A2I0BH27_9ASPA|nr:arginyl-tRNA synthetase [Apostasia shenzhenica]
MSGDAINSAPPQGHAAETVEHGSVRTGSVKQQLSRLFEVSLRATLPEDSSIEPLIAICTAKFGDYQWLAIARNLPPSDIIESTSVAGSGFVNIVLSNKWVAQNIQNMLLNGIGVWAPLLSLNRAVVDFSSPNIAKEMHVGHLRSTIIGDTLARMLEFSEVEVLRRNHVGDWGTQGGDARYRNAWMKICEISRREFDLVYQHLGVDLEERGESFYNPYIPKVLEELTSKGLIKESDGARVIFIEKQSNPLIVVKRDGGYNYASTDLAALWSFVPTLVVKPIDAYGSPSSSHQKVGSAFSLSLYAVILNFILLHRLLGFGDPLVSVFGSIVLTVDDSKSRRLYMHLI